MRYLMPVFAVLLFLACNGNKPDSEQEKQSAADTLITPDVRWKEYANSNYNFQLKLPEQWMLVESNPAEPLPVINLYAPAPEEPVNPPLTVHSRAGAAHVSFYPEGWGMELPAGKRIPLSELDGLAPVDFEWDRDRSMAFLLEDQQVWGYLLYPASPSANWAGGGYIFAQVAVEGFQAQCFDKTSGARKSMEECDPLAGDRVERSGSLDKRLSIVVKEMLRSIAFTEGGQRKEDIGNLIRVEQPLPNQDVGSPLTVKGKARGYWFFEGSFPVTLEDKDGKTLASGIAEAQGKWMTEGFVPFQLTLEFDSPGDERGYLVFEKANPSGLPENAREFRLPVIFR